MRRVLAILLLALLPLQFSGAAVASYCEHETQAGAGHFGHHEHQHDDDASSGTESVTEPDTAADKAPAAIDFDCGHCSVMLTLSTGLSGTLSTALPSACTDESGGANAPTRPERPQWLPLA